MEMKTLIILVTATVCRAAEFQIDNKESGTIWIGIQGNSGKPALEGGGFALQAGQSRTIQSPGDWAGRFWARTWCDDNTKHCLTGDCGNKLECGGAGGAPPATLAEINLAGDNGINFYDVSLVDGFNIPVRFKPVDGQGDNSQYSCKEAGCTQHINDKCPQELQVKNDQGTVIGCKSACAAFPQDDAYCCRGAHGTPETCKASDWKVNYAAFFKKECPDAYSYAYDDHKSTFTCKANKYIITFGG